MKKGNVYFFTGLSGAGKTTIGTLIYKKIKEVKDNVVFLDGDIVRKTYLEDIGYTDEDRLRGSYRTFRLIKLLTEQGIDVVFCGICMYSEIRSWARNNIDNYREIYLKVSKETLLKRNKKKLYTEGKNVVGVDLPFDEPKNSDLVVENNGDRYPEEIASIIFNELKIREEI